MKTKFYQLVLTSMLVLIAFGSNAALNSHEKDDAAAMKAKIAAMTDEQKQARYEEIEARIEEIKALDRSTLTRADRRELKNELRSMQKEKRFLGRHGFIWSLIGIAVIVLILVWIF